MSVRAYKKLHGPTIKNSKLEESDEDKEEEVTSMSSNAFDLLAEEGSEEQQNDDNEEEGKDWLAEEKSKTGYSKKTPNKGKQNISNKKGGKKKKKKGSKNSGKDEEDIDELIKEYADTSVKSTSTHLSDTPTIFSLNIKCLNPELEMLRMFGKEVMNHVAKTSGGIKRVVHRKTILVKPRDDWPKVPYGVTMEFLETKNNLNYFKIAYSLDYQRLQEEFFRCVQTHDPNSFNYILAKNPYHVDSLLQLSEVLKKFGEFDSAKDFVDRSIYCFECSWHSFFNPVPGNCRLDYSIQENRTFFLALFREIQMLGREGCTRTALEYCKLLLGLDPSDPLYVLFLIDSFCIRSDQYEYLIRLYTCDELTDKHLYTLPNFSYSVALAKFHIEFDLKGKLSKPVQEFEKGAAKTLQTSSDELIQQALLLFPMLIPHLIKKLSISIILSESDGSSINVANHGFFSDTYCPPSLKHLITLYVERNYNLWKNQDVLNWLKKNIKIALQRAQSNDPMVKNYEAILKEEYMDSSKNIYNHLLLSEHTESIDSLPPELLHNDGGAQLYDAYYNQPPPNQPIIHAPTNNPIGFFFQSLFSPQIPNAPALPNNPNQLGWYQQMLQYLGAQNAEDEEEDEGME